MAFQTCTLRALLAPLAFEEFAELYLDRQPLIQAMLDRSPLPELLTGRAFERLIAETVIDARDLRVVKDGAADQTHPLFAADGRANVAAVHSAYARGFTVVLNNLHKRRDQVALLCRDLERELGHPVGANAYLTPRGARGLVAHFDNHDVFVLQLEGHKSWRVHETAIELPLADQHFDVSPDGVPALRFEAKLSPGDVLYLPRGTVHSAFTEDSSSLHITFGVSCYRAAEVFLKAISMAAARTPELRRGLPPRGVHGIHWRAQTLAWFLPLLRRIPEILNLADAIEQIEAHFIGQMHPLDDGDMRALDDLDGLSLATIVRQRVGSLCQVTETGQEACILFPGNAVSAPRSLANAFRFVACTARFCIGELPDELSDESKLQLARRLLCSGLLVVDRD